MTHQTGYKAYQLVGLATDQGEINSAIFSMMADAGVEGDEAECLYVLFEQSTRGLSTVFRIAQNATVKAEVDRRNGVVLLTLTYMKYGTRNPLHKLPWFVLRHRNKAIQTKFDFCGVSAAERVSKFLTEIN